ncbi:hypothetical protein MTR67_047895, partial [Solanum verrucosum]
APSTDRRRTHSPSCRSVVRVSNSARTHTNIQLSVDPQSDLRSIGQVTDRGSCPWIGAPKAQPQSQLMFDQHGPSFDARSVVIMPPRRANARNANARNANTPSVPDQEVSNA